MKILKFIILAIFGLFLGCDGEKDAAIKTSESEIIPSDVPISKSDANIASSTIEADLPPQPVVE